MLLRRALIHRKSCKLTNVFVSLFPQLSQRFSSSDAGAGDDKATLASVNKQSILEQGQFKMRQHSKLQQNDQFAQHRTQQQQKTEKQHNVEQTAASDDQEDAHDKRTSTSSKRKTVTSTMQLAAKARREIFDLWKTISAREMALLSSQQTTFSSRFDQNATEAENGVEGVRDTRNKGILKNTINREEKITQLDNDRVRLVQQILHKYKLSVNTSRQYDVSQGLGDAFQRLLLLCLPLPLYISSSPSLSSSAKSTNNQPTAQLEIVLQLAGRNGRQIDVRTVQHLFARTNSFAQALAIFYSLRKCHFAMNMQAYHAMLYSLQRLEEEGWAQRFHEQYISNNKRVLSQQALDFILQGVNNQLLPQNKPWLGRVMYAEGDNVAEKRHSMK